MDLWVLRDVGSEWEIERPATVEDVLGWLREQRAIDYEAAARVARELTSLLPVEFEGSHDATVWALNIVRAALSEAPDA